MSEREGAEGCHATCGTLLGGRVRFAQPARGYRAAIDPVLLAAAVTAPQGGRVVELGCGAGAGLLCLSTRRPDLRLVGIEIDAASVELARANVAANGVSERIEVLVADALRPPPSIGASFDAAFFNPPHLIDSRTDPSPDAGKRRATVGAQGELAAWVAGAIALLRPKATLIVIHRADRLDELLAALGAAAGEIVVYPLWPKAGEAARRVIVRARKGLRSPLRLAPGLALHRPDGSYTDAAERLLRQGEALVI